MREIFAAVLLPVLTAVVIRVIYKKGKIERKTFVICTAGTVLSAFLMVSEAIGGDTQTITELDKTSGENALEDVSLEVASDSGEMQPVTIQVPEQTYTTAEAEAILETQVKELDKEILGENTSFNHIEWDLNLPDTIGSTETQVSWTSTRPDLIAWDGTLAADIPEGAKAVLSAELLLADVTKEYTKDIVLYPSKEEHAWNDALQTATEEENEGRSGSDKVLLPDEWNGHELTWYEKTEKSGGFVCVLMMVAVLVSMFADREQRERELKKHREQLTLQYPELVSKIRLLTSAGLSLRQCIRRLSSFNDEIGRCRYELENGIPEIDAYTHLGENAGTPEYRRLALLLSQNCRRGGQRFSLQLEEESQAAFEARKRNARAMGEKASIRMILPLCLMLCVVLIIVMIPAMASF
ncbi:MAG: type II secretion system F family protein [Eubacteriales bacterium]|jgi:hypothetical protein